MNILTLILSVRDDPVSWMGASNAAGEPNPFVGAVQSSNPFNWYVQSAPHTDQEALESKSIADIIVDNPI